MTPSYTRSALWRRLRSPGMRIALTCLCVALVIALVAYTVDLAELGRLLLAADSWWLLAALGVKLLTPLGTAALYARVLRLLGHTIRAAALWLTAQVASFVTMAFPGGPLAMSAFLLRAFHQRQVPEGVTTLAVVIDALTYQVAFLGLVTVGLGYLLTHGALSVAQISEIGLIALAIVLGGMYLWGLQRDRNDLTRKAVRAQQWLARLLRRPWRPTSVVAFLADPYRGKALLAERPQEFARLLALQIVVLALDMLTLYCAFRALHVAPHRSVIILGYSLANLFSSHAPLPGGGGTFEVTLVLSAVRLGVPAAAALGATLIYRVLTFWLPGLLTAVAYRRLLGDVPHA